MDANLPDRALPVDWRPFAALLIGIVVLAMSPLLARWSEMGPLTAAFWRMVLSLPALWLWDRLSPAPSDVRPSRRDTMLVIFAGLAFAADLGCFHVALVYTSVAEATLIAHLAPMVAVVLAWVVLGEQPTRALWLGLILGLAGGAVMAAGRWVGFGSISGDVVALGSALFYGLYLIAIKEALRVYSTARVMLWSTMAAAVPLFVVAAWTEGNFNATSLSGWVAVAALGLLVHGAGQGLTAVAIAKLPVGPTALALLACPVLSVLLAWPLLGERPNLTQIVGGGAILAALVITRPRG